MVGRATKQSICGLPVDVPVRGVGGSVMNLRPPSARRNLEEVLIMGTHKGFKRS